MVSTHRAGRDGRAKLLGARSAALRQRRTQAEHGKICNDELLQSHQAATENAEIDFDQRPDAKNAFLVGDVGGALEDEDVWKACD